MALILAKNLIRKSLSTRNGKMEMDIRRRVNDGNNINGTLNAVMRNKHITKIAKKNVHNSIIIPRGYWVWQKRLASKINAVICKICIYNTQK